MKFKTLSFLAILLSACISIYAQETTPKSETTQTQDEAIYSLVEVKPEFPGGIAKFYEYVHKNFKVPKKFKGKLKIITQFVIEKDGNISNIKILRGGHAGMEEEAIQLLEASPLWEPGKQNGKPVRVLYALPIAVENK